MRKQKKKEKVTIHHHGLASGRPLLTAPWSPLTWSTYLTNSHTICCHTLPHTIAPRHILPYITVHSHTLLYTAARHSTPLCESLNTRSHSLAASSPLLPPNPCFTLPSYHTVAPTGKGEEEGEEGEEEAQRNPLMQAACPHPRCLLVQCTAEQERMRKKGSGRVVDDSSVAQVLSQP